MAKKGSHVFSGAKGRNLPVFRNEAEVANALEEADLNQAQVLARGKTEFAMEVLGDVAEDYKAAPSARVSAAREILHQGYGRPEARDPSKTQNEGGIHIQVINFTMEGEQRDEVVVQPPPQGKPQKGGLVVDTDGFSAEQDAEVLLGVHEF